MRTRAERSRRAESVESSRQSGRSSQPKSQDSGIVLEESSDQGQDHQNPQLRSRSGKEEVRKNHKITHNFDSYTHKLVVQWFLLT